MTIAQPQFHLCPVCHLSTILIPSPHPLLFTLRRLLQNLHTLDLPIRLTSINLLPRLLDSLEHGLVVQLWGGDDGCGLGVEGDVVGFDAFNLCQLGLERERGSGRSEKSLMTLRWLFGGSPRSTWARSSMEKEGF
jgi:hypothetical protein